MSVSVFPTMAEAQCALSDLIAARYGDAAVIDDLKLGSLPVNIEGRSEKATLLYAHPQPLTQPINTDDILMTVYASEGTLALILQRRGGNE